jgi:hypothetical protein
VGGTDLYYKKEWGPREVHRDSLGTITNCLKVRKGVFEMGGKGAKLGPWVKIGRKVGCNLNPNARQSVQWMLWDCGRHGGPAGNAGSGRNR